MCQCEVSSPVSADDRHRGSLYEFVLVNVARVMLAAVLVLMTLSIEVRSCCDVRYIRCSPITRGDRTTDCRRLSRYSYIVSDLWRQPGCRGRADDAHCRLTVAVSLVSKKPGAGAGKGTIRSRQSNCSRAVLRAVNRKPLWAIGLFLDCN